ncbi:hypothetical protein Elgi_49750 [Paenibacillus elgii]|nr:hypothetical protein Elgi_49750 [Paenibacillus elgii]
MFQIDLIGTAPCYHSESAGLISLKNYETNETDNKTGLRKSFGYFYYNLYRSFLSSNFNFLREEFENFVGNSFNV